MIRKIDEIIAGVRERVDDNFAGRKLNYRLDFRVYGKNGVMGDLEPCKNITSHELGIIIEVIASSQEISNTICSFARSTMLHHGYEGRISTAGNLAFPFSPSDFKAGAVYEFNIHHVVAVDDPCELFPIKTTVI